jgi:hypothetical protein
MPRHPDVGSFTEREEAQVDRKRKIERPEMDSLGIDLRVDD